MGLPAVYVPLPIGNGEQRFNAADVVAAGGGLLVDDAALTPSWIDRRRSSRSPTGDRLLAHGAPRPRRSGSATPTSCWPTWCAARTQRVRGSRETPGGQGDSR